MFEVIKGMHKIHLQIRQHPRPYIFAILDCFIGKVILTGFF